jgi:RHS repeat-associated protein
VIASRHTRFPFLSLKSYSDLCGNRGAGQYGGEKVISNAAPQNYKFTGKERDSESGLDMFGARYYGSSLGRFMTPDWAAKPTDVPYANFGNPQSLNLYSYVQNNPTTVGDPDGHCPICIAVEEFAESPAGEAVENWGAQAFAGAGALITTAVAASGNAGTAYPMYYHGELQNQNGSSIFLSKDNGAQSGDKNVPNPNGTKGAPDHQQTVREEAEKMGGEPEQRVETPGGEKGSRVIDAAKRDENGKVTEATQVIRPNKNGTPPAREVRAAADIQRATGVTPKLVPVRPIKKPDGQ